MAKQDKTKQNKTKQKQPTVKKQGGAAGMELECLFSNSGGLPSEPALECVSQGLFHPTYYRWEEQKQVLLWTERVLANPHVEAPALSVMELGEGTLGGN